MVAAVTRLLVTLVKSISGVWWGQKAECSGLMRKIGYEKSCILWLLA